MNTSGHPPARGGHHDDHGHAIFSEGSRAPVTGEASCPDCTGALDHGRVTHDPTCPIGLDLDRTSADDSAWFAAHPPDAIRRRPMSLSERATYARLEGLAGPSWVTGTTVVRRLAAIGLRHKRFEQVRIVRRDGLSS